MTNAGKVVVVILGGVALPPTRFENFKTQCCRFNASVTLIMQIWSDVVIDIGEFNGASLRYQRVLLLEALMK